MVGTYQSKKLNIGIVTTWFERGASHVSKAYLDALSGHHNVFVYARGGEEYGRGDPVWDREYVTWGKRVRTGIPTYVKWKDFLAWAERHDLDVIIFNEQQSWDVILRSLNLGILIGAYVDYYTPRTVPFFWIYDFLLCNTHRHYGVFKDHPQALFVPWGTDCELFSGDCEPIKEGSTVFFHSSARSWYRKGTDLVVEAFGHVQGETRLIIHSDGLKKHPSVMNIVEQDHRIEVIDKTVHAPGLYHLGDVYVYPSRLDGIGLTMAEALASGLPVIATANPPMDEFVVHGINGRLVPVERFQRRADDYYWDESVCSEEGLANAMQFYVDHRSQLSEFKSQARRYAEDHLDWRKNSADLSKILPRLSRQEKPRELIQMVKWYEYSRYPGLILSAMRRKLLNGPGRLLAP